MSVAPADDEFSSSTINPYGSPFDPLRSPSSGSGHPKNFKLTKFLSPYVNETSRTFKFQSQQSKVHHFLFSREAQAFK